MSDESDNDRGYCDICGYEWSPEPRPRYCPRCDYPTDNNQPDGANDMSERMNDGGPAFPIGDEHNLDVHGERTTPRYPGMSLRDYYAGQVLVGLVACSAMTSTPVLHPPWEQLGIGYNEWVVGCCWTVADAMLAARDQKGASK